MAHTQNEIVESRLALSAAIHKEIQIHQHYIAALKNALSAMKLVAAINQPVPIDQQVVCDEPPAKTSFIKNLSEKITHAGNGH